MEGNRLIKSVPLKIEGSFGLVSKSVSDIRGTLTRIWENSLISTEFRLKQASIVGNPISFTLRGLHYQKFPFSETKIIQCISGKAFDVILDLRKESNTYGEHITLEIGPGSEYQGLVVPSGCAHGYMTLEANSTLIYFMDNTYSTFLCHYNSSFSFSNSVHSRRYKRDMHFNVSRKIRMQLS